MRAEPASRGHGFAISSVYPTFFCGLSCGDALVFKWSQPRDFTYGAQFTPATGGDVANSILIDLDNEVSSQDKSVYGDIDVYKFSKPADPITGSVGSFIWHDLDQDGLQDDNEPGLEDVKVTLYNVNGGSKTALASTTTDANGQYIFDKVEEGTYYIDVEAPAGFAFSAQDQGSDDTLDSDVDPSTGESANFKLGEGEDNKTLDAGLHQPAGTIGDFVWNDLDGDGIQDDDEPGLEGVWVLLYTCDDKENHIDKAQTDANGGYTFKVRPGEYCLGFTDLPAGFTFSPQNAGGDDTADSDVDPNTGETACFKVQPGEKNDTVDAGLHEPKATIGNFVWSDLDGDGIQDAGEPGLEKVKVALYECENKDEPVATTETDADGAYSFSVKPGAYCVGFSGLPAGFIFSARDQGGDDTLDSDVKPDTGETACFKVEAGQNNDTVDAGAYQPAAMLGDFVWHDLDGDGVQDDDEPGIKDVTVTLYACDNKDEALADTQTDADGAYSFSVKPGAYCVVFSDLPAGFGFTPQNQGGDDKLDSDADPDTGETQCVKVDHGMKDTSLDAGLIQFASLGDFVWDDQDRDGIQDAGEPGVEGVTVLLYHCDNKEKHIDKTETDANGKYAFTNLKPGKYCVVFTDLPAGFVFSAQNQGSDDAADSDANPDTGESHCVELNQGDTDKTVDAGINKPPSASLGNFVWHDLDGDGIQDDDEPGIEGVKVTLYACDDKNTALASVATGAGGFYQFNDLAAGEYCVTFSELPAGFQFTVQDAGSDDAADSDANPDTGESHCVKLEDGEVNHTVDAGIFQEKATIGDMVWNDLDGDGVQDDGEPGVKGVTVTLYTCDNKKEPVASTETDENGKYSFSVKPDKYCLVFSNLPAGFIFSPQDQISDDALDSDADPDTGQTACIPVNPGQNNDTVDAGIYEQPLFRLGNFVWDDLNYNGIQDPGEPGLEGITVELYHCDDKNTLLADTQTNADGAYGFSNLEEGKYCVVFKDIPVDYIFSPQDQGADDGVDSDADPNTGQTECIKLNEDTTTNGANLTVDAGLARKRIDLTLDKTVDNDTPTVGDTILFSITVRNESNIPLNATGVEITDVLPAGVSFVDFVDRPGLAAYDSGTHTITWNPPTMSYAGCPAASCTPTFWTLTFEVKVETDEPFENCAEVTEADQKDRDSRPADGEGDDYDCVEVKPVPPLGDADLCITKAVDNGMPEVGEEVTFTLLATNNGPADAENVNVIDLLPAGLTYVSHNATQGTYDSGTGVWAVGDLANGASATLTIKALVSEEGAHENCATIACAQDDPNEANDKSCVAVNTEGSSGGGSAGVESQNYDELAVLLGRRLFDKTLSDAHRIAKRNGVMLQPLDAAFQDGSAGVHGLGSLNSVIEQIIPEAGPSGTTGFVSTPDDLIGFTNATSVFAADYMRADDRRAGAIFATSSPAGELYNHTKVICDRFGGGIYDGVQHVVVNGQSFVMAKMIHLTEEVDYAIEFAVYQNGGQFEVENRFSWGEYQPRGDGEVLNFQVWAATPQYTMDLVKTLLDNLASQGTVVYQGDTPELPQAYIRKGHYDQGVMHLEVVNLSDAPTATFIGYLNRYENDTEPVLFEQSIPFPPGEERVDIALETGPIYSANFDVYLPHTFARDRVYQADGGWSYSHDENTTISGFDVKPQGEYAARGDYMIERSARLSGRVGTGGWASLFRWIQPDRVGFDASAYKTIQFEARGSGRVMLQLQKASITNGDHYSATITLSPAMETHTITFDELARANGTTSSFTAHDLNLIAFFPEGSGSFDIEVENVRLIHTKITPNEDDLVPHDWRLAQNYPNPFNPETTIEFALPEAGAIRLVLYDMLGREVMVMAEGRFPAGVHRTVLDAQQLASGTYIYRLETPHRTLTQKLTLLK